MHQTNLSVASATSEGPSESGWPDQSTWSSMRQTGDAMSRLVDRIYECAFVPDLWPEILAELDMVALLNGLRPPGSSNDD